MHKMGESLLTVKSTPSQEKKSRIKCACKNTKQNFSFASEQSTCDVSTDLRIYFSFFKKSSPDKGSHKTVSVALCDS